MTIQIKALKQAVLSYYAVQRVLIVLHASYQLLGAIQIVLSLEKVKKQSKPTKSKDVDATTATCRQLARALATI